MRYSGEAQHILSQPYSGVDAPPLFAVASRKRNESTLQLQHRLQRLQQKQQQLQQAQQCLEQQLQHRQQQQQHLQQQQLKQLNQQQQQQQQQQPQQKQKQQQQPSDSFAEDLSAVLACDNMYVTSSDSSSISDSDDASQADSEADVALVFAQLSDTKSDATAVSIELRGQHNINELSTSSSKSSYTITSNGESFSDVADDVAQHNLSSHQLAPVCSDAIRAAAPAEQQQQPQQWPRWFQPPFVTDSSSSSSSSAHSGKADACSDVAARVHTLQRYIAASKFLTGPFAAELKRYPSTLSVSQTLRKMDELRQRRVRTGHAPTAAVIRWLQKELRKTCNSSSCSMLGDAQKLNAWSAAQHSRADAARCELQQVCSAAISKLFLIVCSSIDYQI
jgi:hypothetical protein